MSESNFTDVVILAGGFGERLWPASKPDFPKQFMSLEDGTSFLQSAVLRALSINPEGKIIIVTRKDILNQVCIQCSQLKEKVTAQQKEKLAEDLLVIAEPCARHTCAPILLSCKYLDKCTGSSRHTVLVLASDHVIMPEEAFASDCKKAAKMADEGNFVCFAINPTEPSTGYGYIKGGECLDSENSVFKIDTFKEKPDAETAKAYVESGNYWWNSGMFGFTSEFFQKEIAEQEKDIAKDFEVFDSNVLPEIDLIENVRTLSRWAPMEQVYSKVKAIAVDNAVAEKTSKAVVVKASFNWDDVGSWDALEKFFTKKNPFVTEVEAENNFVYSDIPVAMCGVKDLIVVVKNGKCLVMKKGKSNLMREVVKKINPADK